LVCPGSGGCLALRGLTGDVVRLRSWCGCVPGSGAFAWVVLCGDRLCSPLEGGGGSVRMRGLALATGSGVSFVRSRWPLAGRDG
jgi:hypothetical protein